MDDLFLELRIRQQLTDIKEAKNMTWEQVAKALYQILDDIDTADDIVKEDVKLFQGMVRKLQAKKNQYLQSPDGSKIESAVSIKEKKNQMSSEEMVEWILSHDFSDWSGKIGYEEAKHIAGYADNWILVSLPLSLFDWVVKPSKKYPFDPTPVIVGKQENEYEVLDGKHRIGMAKYLGKETIKAYIPKPIIGESTIEPVVGIKESLADRKEILNKTISSHHGNVRAFLKDVRGEFITSNRITYGEMVDVIKNDKGLSVDIEEEPVDPSYPFGDTVKKYIVKLEGKKLRPIPKEVYDAVQISFETNPKGIEEAITADYKKGFKLGYNSPGNFDQKKLLQSNSDLAKGVVAGITKRAKDQQDGIVSFILSDADLVSKLKEGFGTSLATAGLIGASFLGSKALTTQHTTPTKQVSQASPTIDMQKIARIESSNNPKAVNKRTGARGLTQIMKATWEEMVQKMGNDWSWEDAFDGEKNLAVGTYYMNTEIPRLLKHYGIKDTIENRLTAYNWGVGNLKSGKDFPKETENYVRYYKSMKEAVLIKNDSQKLMVQKYKNVSKKLTLSTFPREDEQFKFWILNNGMLIPVKYSHGETAREASTDFRELWDSGAIRGYVSETGEMGIDSKELPNPKQRSVLRNLFIAYKVFSVLGETANEVYAVNPTSVQEFEYNITYGVDESKQKLTESLVDHAKKELELAGLFDKDSDYNGMLGEAVMELMTTFAKQGHFGFSAILTTDLFSKLVEYKPLTELTNNPDEWQDVMEWYGGKEEEVKDMRYQNIRCPSCFSTDGGKTYYNIDEMCEDVFEETGEVIAFKINNDKKIIHTSVEYKKDKVKESSISPEVELKKAFVPDRIVILQHKIKGLEQLAKSTPKGQSLSHIYSTMDELEREIIRIQKELGEARGYYRAEHEWVCSACDLKILVGDLKNYCDKMKVPYIKNKFPQLCPKCHKEMQYY